MSNINKIKWNLVNFCENDIYAEKSYCSIHNVDKNLNLKDITKINAKDIKDFNMMVWGFPCQSISVAGAQDGFIDKEGNKTKSGLYYDGLRILKEKKPYLSIIENVKNLTSQKFKVQFNNILKDLDEVGYNNYWEILNSNDFGIPQNRKRIYIISIRKDLDNGNFKFPKPIDNKPKLIDFLEDEVDKIFYIKSDKVKRFVSELNNKNTLLFDSCQIKRETKAREYNECSPTLNARDYKDPRIINVDFFNKLKDLNKVIQIGNIVNTGNWKNPQRGRIYSINGISPTLCCVSGGGLEPKIMLIKNEKINLRKLTPKEYFRLMGFSDEDFYKAKYDNKDGKGVSKVSNSQLYKQAGNSIVTNVLFYIYLEIYKVMPYLFIDIQLGSFFSGIGAFEVALDNFVEYINNKKEI